MDRENIFIEVGQTGLKRSSGMIFEEFLPQLSGIRALRIYREMTDNDAIIGAMLFAINMLVRGVEWRVEPANQEPQSLADADFVESCLDDMSIPFKDVLSEVLTMLSFGYSVHEIIYKRRVGPHQDNPSMRSKFTDGLIGWRKFPIRSQDSIDVWDFDDAGGIQGVYQIPPPSYDRVFLPIEKMLLFRTTVHKGNPEGKSILRNSYRCWYFKKNIEMVEGIGIERDLAGLPVVWVPPEVLRKGSAEASATFNAMQEIIRNIRRDEQEGVMMPLIYDEKGNKIYDLALLSTGGRRQFDTNAIVQRYDQRIAMTVMADFILLGHEKVGSFALSSSKTHLFSQALGAWLDSIAGIFNRYAIPRLFLLNGRRLTDLPKIVHGDIETPNLGELGKFIGELVGAGFDLFPDANLEDHIRSAAGFPAKSEL